MYRTEAFTVAPTDDEGDDLQQTRGKSDKKKEKRNVFTSSKTKKTDEDEYEQKSNKSKKRTLHSENEDENEDDDDNNKNHDDEDVGKKIKNKTSFDKETFPSDDSDKDDDTIVVKIPQHYIIPQPIQKKQKMHNNNDQQSSSRRVETSSSGKMIGNQIEYEEVHNAFKKKIRDGQNPPFQELNDLRPLGIPKFKNADEQKKVFSKVIKLLGLKSGRQQQLSEDKLANFIFLVAGLVNTEPSRLNYPISTTGNNGSLSRMGRRIGGNTNYNLPYVSNGGIFQRGQTANDNSATANSNKWSLNRQKKRNEIITETTRLLTLTKNFSEVDGAEEEIEELRNALDEDKKQEIKEAEEKRFLDLVNSTAEWVDNEDVTGITHMHHLVYAALNMAWTDIQMDKPHLIGIKSEVYIDDDLMRPFFAKIVANYITDIRIQHPSSQPLDKASNRNNIALNQMWQELDFWGFDKDSRTFFFDRSINLKQKAQRQSYTDRKYIYVPQKKQRDDFRIDSDTINDAIVKFY